MEPRGSVDWEQGQPHRARPAENAPPRAASPSQLHGRLPRNLLLPHMLCQNPAARTSKAGETGARQVAESLPRAARVQMADRWRKHGGTNGLRELHAREDETPPLGRFWPGYGRDLDAEAARRKPCWTTPGPDRGRGQMPIAKGRNIIARSSLDFNRVSRRKRQRALVSASAVPEDRAASLPGPPVYGYSDDGILSAMLPSCSYVTG